MSFAWRQGVLVRRLYFRLVGIEWPSLVASGTLSAVISGIVSVVTARRAAGHQEAGRLAAQARRRMRELVGPELTKVRQYQSRSLASFGRSQEEVALHQSDFEFCARLLIASAELTWWRQRCVRRRLRKLFGANTVELCGIHGQDAVSVATGIVLQRQAMALAHPEFGLKQPDWGRFDLALRRALDSREISKLISSLDRLAKSW